MREIKFRIWDDNLKVLYTPEKDDEIKNLWRLPEMNGGRLIVEDHIKVMQFTGLHDKNGKEIYEDDIVKDKYHSIGTVQYALNIGGFISRIDKEDSVLEIQLDQRRNEFEVIGNIYENPELLNQ